MDQEEATEKTGVRAERLCGNIEGDFVVFLIGMRINHLWAIHKWFPTLLAMPKMIQELARDPGLGFLGSETWFGRAIIMIQYWRSTEQLMDYAANKEAQHLPAWRDFNRRVAKDGSVGIFHETFPIQAGAYESIYVNMPPFGLGKASNSVPAVGHRANAQERLHVQLQESME